MSAVLFNQILLCCWNVELFFCLFHLLLNCHKISLARLVIGGMLDLIILDNFFLYWNFYNPFLVLDDLLLEGLCFDSFCWQCSHVVVQGAVSG